MTIAFADMPWEMLVRGARTKTVVRDGKRLRLVEFGLDFVERDWCTRGHAGFLLDGAMEVDIDGTVFAYQAGDGLLIPAGAATRHRHHATLRPTTLFLVEDVE